MPIVTGGWTVDGGYVECLDKTGMAVTLFNAQIVEAIKQKLIAIEVAGDLTAPEKALRQVIVTINCATAFLQPWALPADLERIAGFIRLEPKWSRGVYMPFADLVVCINNQWTNILKKYA
jgi:hypothetical protein